MCDTMSFLHLSLIIFISLNLSFTTGNEPPSKRVHAGRIPSKVKEFGEKLSPGESPDSLLIRSENIPHELRDLKREHQLLYLRARLSDYDFAKFGDTCLMFSTEELHAFLRIVKESIEPSEMERDLHLRLSPAEKGERLEKLFNHSKTICDFRNLLTCHKNYRTCACAHPSMGLNREGVCGINIGHICEFSQRTLNKHGVLLTPETSPIKCLLENAECVMDSTNDIFGDGISPIRKICKCRKGYWGATCRRRTDEETGNYLQNQPEQRIKASKKSPSKAPVTKEEKEAIENREFWIHEGGSLLGGHSFHPEEVKERLVKMMSEQDMYFPDEREEKAQILMKGLEQDVEKEDMVMNELRLRDLAKLKLGDACDPERQIILDNPPMAKDGPRWVDPHPEDIKSWQLGLLQDKKPFCNIYKHFRCDAISRVCQCKAGLEPDPKSGGTACVIPLGYNCGPDFDPILEFDPLKDRKRFSESMPPDCVDKTECKDQGLFFEKKCWCKSDETCNEFNIDTFKSQVKAMKSRFVLALGDSCDPAIHQQLLSYGNSMDPGYQKRVALIQDLVQNPESRLCDISNYLNCSETLRTCQCWKQLQPRKNGGDENGNNQCVATNLASCGRTFEYGKYLYKEGSQLWQVEKAFDSYFRPECIADAKCAGGDDLEWAGRCICHDSSKTGEMCKDKKAILATAFKARQIPNSDEDDVSLIRVFFDLNQQTNLLEALMTLKINEPCDPDTGLKLDRVVKFWKEIGSSDDTTKERRVLKHFVALTKWTKYLVNTVQGGSAALCNATIGLRCHRTSGACGCPRGARWFGDRCYLEIDEVCDPKPGADWIPTCIAGTKCLSLRRNNYGTYQCTSCPGGKLDCEGNENDESIFDTWEEYHGHMLDDKSLVKEYLQETYLVTSNDSNVDQDDTVAKGTIVDENAEDSENLMARSKGILQSRLLTGQDMYQTKQEEGQTPGKVSNAVAKADILTQHQRDTYVDEIERMLKDILTNRMIPFGTKCHHNDEKRLTEIFPSLPIYNLNRFTDSIPKAYSVLSRLYWQGISFCNRKQFLSCTLGGTCGCAAAFGLIHEGEECRLKEDKYCRIVNEEPMKAKSKFPSFKCKSGTKCTKVDYGLPICAKSEKAGKAERGRMLQLDDRGREINDENEGDNSASSRNKNMIAHFGSAGCILTTFIVHLIF